MKQLLLLFFTLGFISVVIFRYPAESSQSAAVLGQEASIERELNTEVDRILEGTKGEYSIAVKNLKTGENYYRNADKVYESGSLYKLWVMATVYGQIETGKIKEDETISEKITTLNNIFGISPDAAELTSGTISLTTKSALNQMITISHNYAALLLTQKVKLSSVKLFLEENNFKESSVGVSGESPKTTVSDIAIFFEKLYQGELGNEKSTQEMLDLLKGQKLNSKLPRYLPAGTTVAHKTGEVGWYSHDGGIVYHPKGDYIIVVMTESNIPKGAEEKIAQISQAVYLHFEK